MPQPETQSYRKYDGHPPPLPQLTGAGDTAGKLPRTAVGQHSTQSCTERSGVQSYTREVRAAVFAYRSPERSAAVSLVQRTCGTTALRC